MVTGTVPEGSRAFAEVDEVEAVERDAVDGEDAALGVEIVLEDVTYQSCEVVMKTKQIGPLAFNSQGKSSVK